MSASLNPAFASCFFARVTLAKELPTFSTIGANESALIVPTTLSVKAPEIIST